MIPLIRVYGAKTLRFDIQKQPSFSHFTNDKLLTLKAPFDGTHISIQVIVRIYQYLVKTT